MPFYIVKQKSRLTITIYTTANPFSKHCTNLLVSQSNQALCAHLLSLLISPTFRTTPNRPHIGSHDDDLVDADARRPSPARRSHKWSQTDPLICKVGIILLYIIFIEVRKSLIFPENNHILNKCYVGESCPEI